MIAVVIGTYNEASNIEKLLNELTKYTVIIVDDNSPDGTADIARKFSNVTVIVPEERLGIAKSYKRGFVEALKLKPEYVIQMDAGLTHDPKDIAGMVKLAKSHAYSLVYGSRFSNVPRLKGYRSLISLGARTLMGFIHVHMSDATCGFRCWSPTALYNVVIRNWLSEGFSFQLETAYLTNKLFGGEEMHEYPIEYILTNSSFNPKILMEALWVYSIMLLS